MSTPITHRLGAAVIYTLNEADVSTIVNRRRAAGHATKGGNDPRAGESYPGIIVRDFGMSSDEFARVWDKTEAGEYAEGMSTDPADGGAPLEEIIKRQLVSLRNRYNATSVNIQVFLDGDDAYWATSRSMFDTSPGGGHGRWVQVVDAAAGSDGHPAKIDKELPAGYAIPGNDPSTVVGPDGVTHQDIQWRPDRRGHWMWREELIATILEYGSEVIADTTA
jgi:hypothetical protein